MTVPLSRLISSAVRSAGARRVPVAPHPLRVAIVVGFVVCALASSAFAQPPALTGTVRDETGDALPGVTVEVRGQDAAPVATVTDATGAYRIDHVAPGEYQVSFTLLNFAETTRTRLRLGAGTAQLDAVMHLTVSAHVTVTGKATFSNLADAEHPAESLIGIADAASQGAVTAEQLDGRPLMRTGEVLETIPGMITTQHSGEGKANQYFLRGFNLDHGTDFAQTIAGIPVNLPTNAHGQGYSDVNFMIPELVSGIQFSKGPYYANQGDFATAGASNVNYVTALDRPLVHVEGGLAGYGRALLAGSTKVGDGTLLAAGELAHDDGPWTHADDFRKLNGVLRYSRGDATSGLALTAMAYHGEWNSSDQIPLRAVTDGLISRFGAIDPTDGGRSDRYSVSADWQRTSSTSLTKVTAYGLGYDLDLFSDFTYSLDDPVHGDQFEQADHRFVSGGQISHTRLSRWGGHFAENTAGVDVRNDDITSVGLYHTQGRVRLDTRSQDAVIETTAGVYAESHVTWTPWLRTMAGLRADGARFGVTDELIAANSGVARAGLVSPKGSVTIGPWRAMEVYVDAGEGFHSNDARGTTIAVDVDGNPVSPVTPLVRAKGLEVGIRSVAIAHLQTTLSVWDLRLASELVFDGDTAGSEPSGPSARHGVEFANYYRPRPWLVFDGDVSWSQARFTDPEPDGEYVPEAVGTVVSAGATIDSLHRVSGSVRWRYFGPRALTADNVVRSEPTSLVDFEAGYAVSKRRLRVNVGIFNVLNVADSDVDYYYVSRLPGEPVEGVADIHTHPTPPRTVRITCSIDF